MKKLSSKIMAMIALAITGISFALVIGALVLSFVEPPADSGVSGSFALWVFSVLTAMLSLVFYGIDAIANIFSLRKKKGRLFRILLILVILGSYPMVIYVGGGLGINILLWNLYYLLMAVLEVISIRQIIRENRKFRAEVMS